MQAWEMVNLSPEERYEMPDADIEESAIALDCDPQDIYNLTVIWFQTNT